MAFFPVPDADSFGDIPEVEGATGETQAINLILGLVTNLRYLIGAIAVVLIVYAGSKLVVQGGNEDLVKKQKSALTWGIIGLMLIAMAGPVSEVFTLTSCTVTSTAGGINEAASTYGAAGSAGCGDTVITYDSFISNPTQVFTRVKIFDDQVQILIIFMKYMLGSIAVLYIVRSGMRLVTGGGEEEMTKEKKTLMTSGIGLVLVMLSDRFVRSVFYVLPEETTTNGIYPTVDAEAGVSEIIGATNLLVTFAAPVAILGMVIGAIMIIASGGKEDMIAKGKKFFINSVIAIIIIYGAFGLVSTFINGVF